MPLGAWGFLRRVGGRDEFHVDRETEPCLITLRTLMSCSATSGIRPARSVRQPQQPARRRPAQPEGQRSARPAQPRPAQPEGQRSRAPGPAASGAAGGAAASRAPGPAASGAAGGAAASRAPRHSRTPAQPEGQQPPRAPGPAASAHARTPCSRRGQQHPVHPRPAQQHAQPRPGQTRDLARRSSRSGRSVRVRGPADAHRASAAGLAPRARRRRYRQNPPCAPRARPSRKRRAVPDAAAASAA